MQPLRASALRGSRLHLFLLKLLFTVVGAVLAVAEIVAAPAEFRDELTRPALGSAEYLAMGLQPVAFGLLVAVWYAPRLTLLWAVPVLWIVPLGGSLSSTAWRALAVASAVALLWILVRERVGRPDGGPVVVRVGHTYDESYARVEKLGLLIGRIAIAAGLAASVVLVVVHQVLVTDTVAFEERADRVQAELVGVDEEGPWIVKLGDREVLVEPPWEDPPAIGATVTVLVDPEDPERISLLAAAEEHSGLIGLAVAAPLAGAAFGAGELVRDRRRRALLQRGAVGVHARYVSGEDSATAAGGRILPIDGVWPGLVLTDLDGAVPQADVDGLSDRWLDGEDYDSGDSDAEDAAIPEEGELARWADAVYHDATLPEGQVEWDAVPETERPLVEALEGPEVKGAEHVVLLGNWADGSSVAVLRETGQVWLAEVKEPRSRRRFIRDLTYSLTTEARGRLSRLEKWWLLNHRWARWLLPVGAGVACGLLLPWLLSGDDYPRDIWDWAGVLMLAASGVYLPFIPHEFSVGELSRSRRGFTVSGLFADDVVAPDRLVTVSPGEAAVAVRVRDPEDVYVVFPEQVGRDLAPTAAASEMRRWFESAPPGSRSGRAPSPAVVGAVVMMVMWAVQAVQYLP